MGTAGTKKQRDSRLRETARRVLGLESSAVAALVDRLDESFDRAAELLVGCRGRVIVTGMGKSGIICQKLAATFSSTGTPAFFMHPAEALHGDLGKIVAGDLLLAISNSGETHEVVRLLELVRRLGAEIVAMTGDPSSTLARHADVHLHVGVDQEACGMDLVPTASTCAQMAMGDALALVCCEARGFTSEDFARVHPGGRIGGKLRLVRSMMHSGEELPRVRETTSMRDTITEMSAKRLGMACVVDGEGRLTGVVTDGDLRRRMMRVSAVLEGSAADAMTTSPTTISPDAVASEALKVMEERKITSLPVVENGGRLVGVVHLHDLWRTELI
jgi:arabinose-5-phosphate isomerase